MDKLMQMYHTMPPWFQDPMHLVYVLLFVACVFVTVWERGAE